MYQSWYQYCCWCWIIYDAFLINSSAVSNDTFFKLMTFLFQVSLSYWIMKMVQWSIIVNSSCTGDAYIQYIPRNMHTVFALLCFVVVIHWLIFPYPSGLLHWHCGNLTIAPVPAKQPWWIWINTSCEFIMNDCITTTKQSTTKPCAYFLGYTVCVSELDHKSNDYFVQVITRTNAD